MKRWIVAPVLALSLAAGGCANMSPEDRRAAGAIVGGIVGAAAGSQIGGGTEERIAAAAVGAFIGAYIGDQIAQYLNEEEAAQLAEQQRLALMQQQAAQPTYQSWRSEDGTKTARIEAKPAKKTTKAKIKAATKKKTATPDDPLLTNLNEKYDELPEATACRDMTTTLATPGGTVTDTGRYCQDASGQYVRVADVETQG